MRNTRNTRNSRGTHIQGHLSPQTERQRRKRRVAGAALAVGVSLTLIVLLTTILSSAALRLLSGLASSTPAGTSVSGGQNHVSTPPTRAAVQAPTLTPLPGGDWKPYVNVDYGFRLDVPSVLGSTHGYFINNFTGQGFDLTYTGVPAATPLQTLEEETSVTVLFSTTITDMNICPSAGTPVTLGTGIAGRQETNTLPAPNTPTPSMPYVQVSIVLNGVAIRLVLNGQGSPDTFLTRYGALWRHMLASFGPVPGAPTRTTHPCG